MYSVADMRYTPGMTTKAERFWSRVVQGTGCWAWSGYTSKAGYGQFSFGGRKVYAHRVSWEIAHGPLPSAVHVLHKCDNPPCTNPEHLFVGSHGDNMRDMTAKGRNRGCIVSADDRRGESHPRTTLTEADVLAIRAAWPGVRQVDLALRYGVRQTTISNILRRVTWGHVP